MGIDRLDGVLHAIGFAPAGALGGNFLSATWADVSTAVQISTFSLMALARAALPLMDEQSAVVGLDFDATVAWPVYDWMGVAKAGLESASRYLARELGPSGIRVNLSPPGRCGRWPPSRSRASRRSRRPGSERAPLGWDIAGHRTGRARLRGAVVRLVPGDDRRDRARRRRGARVGA